MLKVHHRVQGTLNSTPRSLKIFVETMPVFKPETTDFTYIIYNKSGN